MLQATLKSSSNAELLPGSNLCKSPISISTPNILTSQVKLLENSNQKRTTVLTKRGTSPEKKKKSPVKKNNKKETSDSKSKIENLDIMKEIKDALQSSRSFANKSIEVNSQSSLPDPKTRNLILKLDQGVQVGGDG